MSDSCACSRCNRPTEIVYLGISLCFVHWCEFAAEDTDAEERLQWLSKRLPQRWRPRVAKQLDALRRARADLPTSETTGRVRLDPAALERVKKHHGETPERRGSDAGG